MPNLVILRFSNESITISTFIPKSSRVNLCSARQRRERVGFFLCKNWQRTDEKVIYIYAHTNTHTHTYTHTHIYTHTYHLLRVVCDTV